jgi:hypothetical protein
MGDVGLRRFRVVQEHAVAGEWALPNPALLRLACSVICLRMPGRKETLSDRMKAVFGDLSARPEAFAANG